MNKPLIGITAGEIINKEYPNSLATYGQVYTFVDAVMRAGGLPVILPLSTDNAVLDDLMNRVDGLLLAGGNDVNPALYNQQPYNTTGTISELRDNTEYHLLTKAIELQKPVLGICRGMQLLNVYMGGTLHQHIPHDLPGSIAHQVVDPSNDPLYDAHSVLIKPGTKLHQILGTDTVKANSYHHQAVKELGEGLRITAHCMEDNLIEGIETEDDRFIIGVQPHPESIIEQVPTWLHLFEAFVQNASNEKGISSSHRDSEVVAPSSMALPRQ